MKPSQYSRLIVTLYTLSAGALGAGLAYWLSFPFYVITGPAILITLLSLAGLRFEIPDPVRDAAFLLIGIFMGSGMNSEASAAFMRWPVAFVALAVLLVAIVLACGWVMVKFFDYDRRSAVLAASPGHLSYVLSLGISLDINVGKIAVVQSVRLLALTLTVPLAAMALGMEVGDDILPKAAIMQPLHMMVLLVLSLLVGLVLQRFKVPAALLIGGLIVSSLAHLGDLTPGTLSPAIALPCFAMIGTLIGTRFSGLSFLMLRQALWAGLITTFVAVIIAALGAFPVAWFIGMPVAHVLVAFAPGGLETMVAMGVMLDANPGFVAACHVGRLLFLSVLIPSLLARGAPSHV
jgi:membrane AbrB-like protein